MRQCDYGLGFRACRTHRCVPSINRGFEARKSRKLLFSRALRDMEVALVVVFSFGMLSTTLSSMKSNRSGLTYAIESRLRDLS